MASEYSVKQLLDASTWYEILSGADDAVCDNADAGFTTLIALCVSNDRSCGASCGDSGALLVSSSQFVSLTENQRKNPPVGSSAASPVAFSTRFGAHDKLIIMSDGVWRFVGNDAIAELARAREGQELISALRQLQLQQNGGKLPDDFSLILVQ